MSRTPIPSSGVTISPTPYMPDRVGDVVVRATTDWHYTTHALAVLDIDSIRVVTITITDMLYLSLITVPNMSE